MSTCAPPASSSVRSSSIPPCRRLEDRARRRAPVPRRGRRNPPVEDHVAVRRGRLQARHHRRRAGPHAVAAAARLPGHRDQGAAVRPARRADPDVDERAVPDGSRPPVDERQDGSGAPGRGVGLGPRGHVAGRGPERDAPARGLHADRAEGPVAGPRRPPREEVGGVEIARRLLEARGEGVGAGYRRAAGPLGERGEPRRAGFVPADRRRERVDRNAEVAGGARDAGETGTPLSARRRRKAAGHQQDRAARVRHRRDLLGHLGQRGRHDPVARRLGGRRRAADELRLEGRARRVVAPPSRKRVHGPARVGVIGGEPDGRQRVERLHHRHEIGRLQADAHEPSESGPHRLGLGARADVELVEQDAEHPP